MLNYKRSVEVASKLLILNERGKKSCNASVTGNKRGLVVMCWVCEEEFRCKVSLFISFSISSNSCHGSYLHHKCLTQSRSQLITDQHRAFFFFSSQQAFFSLSCKTITSKFVFREIMTGEIQPGVKSRLRQSERGNSEGNCRVTAKSAAGFFFFFLSPFLPLSIKFMSRLLLNQRTELSSAN